MNSGSVLQRHRALRWLAPVAVLGAAGIAAGGMMAAKASPEPLPPTTPVALLAGMQTTSAPGFSGTVVAQMSLGLPELPGITGASESTSLTSLLAGSHTLRVWFGGPDEQRVALLGVTDEVDVFHSGSDVWQWDSSTHTATHLTVPTGSGDEPKPLVTPESPSTLTPQELASRALAALDKSTEVRIDGTRTVADRSAYVVLLTPRDTSTRIGSVKISVDGKTKLPLAVQVYARGASAPAIDVAFTDVSFRAPASSYFRFTPPPGATVHDDAHPSSSSSASDDATEPHGFGKAHVVGSGWSSVLELRASAKQVQQLTKGALRTVQHVSGAWGTGRLVDSALLSALITDDGRVYAGAVDPSALYAAASASK